MNNDKLARKALEIAVQDASADILAIIPAAVLNDPAWIDKTKLPFRWPNKPFLESQPVYLRTTFSVSNVTNPELGPNGRQDYVGTFLVGIYTPEDGGPDLADDIKDLVRGALARNVPLTFMGVSVEISVVKPQPAAAADGHWYQPVMAYWNLWRVT